MTIIKATNDKSLPPNCKLFVVGEPQMLLIQPSARHEEKNNGVQREVDLIAERSAKGFAIVFFDCTEWARALMPWADDAVSRDDEVGRHAPDTLRFVEHCLLPRLRQRFGALPCIIGGYSLGGLFALWAARNSNAFSAIAAASPSLWIRGWGEYAASHPILIPTSDKKAYDELQMIRQAGSLPSQCDKKRYDELQMISQAGSLPSQCNKSQAHNELRHSIVHLSLGDREELCRNQRMQRIGDCVRAEYALLCTQLSSANVTLKWHPGGHFGAEAERTAEAFAWCIEQIRC